MIIEVKNLVKTFKNGDKETEVLKGLNLSVKAGEFVSITGRSGSGKSTLLYQIGLLDHPTAGDIIIDGVDTHKLSISDRIVMRLEKLGYIFQDYAILPELTAVENIMLPLLMQGLHKNAAHKKSMEALERISLGHRANSLPNQMSGGEQQRVSIARAIAHDPTIIFADEPTANLDSETARVVMDTFLELNRAGQTIVMVTHEPEYAEIGHRMVVLKDGIIVEEIKGHLA
jgi:putative ABC transport system ATP-binding protein